MTSIPVAICRFFDKKFKRLYLKKDHYFVISPRFRDKLTWKKSALVTSEITLLFGNTLTPDDKYTRRNMLILWQQLQTLLSQEEKTFRGFFIAFPK